MFSVRQITSSVPLEIGARIVLGSRVYRVIAVSDSLYTVEAL